MEPSDPAAKHEGVEEALRLGFVSDAQEMGERPGLKRALAELDAWGAEWLLYGGDTNYDHMDAPWDWKEAMEPFEDRTLFVYGNHDGGPRYADYHPGDSEPPWWVWRDGNVTILGLHTSREMWNGTPQFEWLENELAKETQNRTVIVLMHISWWMPNEHHGADLAFQGDADEMDALVQRHGVDLVLAGHEHYYSRMVREDTTFIVNGPVEAQTRPVPGSVMESSEKASTDRTWMQLEILSCGIAGWTHNVTTGERVDAFVTTERVRIEQERAECIPPPAPLTMPSETAAAPDRPAERSPPSRALARGPLLMGAAPLAPDAPPAPPAAPQPHAHPHEAPPAAPARDPAPPLQAEGALVVVIPQAAAWMVVAPAALLLGFVLGRRSMRETREGGGGGRSRRVADALDWGIGRLRSLRAVGGAGWRAPSPRKP